MWSMTFRRSLRHNSAKPLVYTSTFCLSICMDTASLCDSKRCFGFSTKTCGHNTTLASRLAEGSHCPEPLSQARLAAKGHPGIRTRIAFSSCPYNRGFLKCTSRILAFLVTPAHAQLCLDHASSQRGDRGSPLGQKQLFWRAKKLVFLCIKHRYTYSL